MMDPTSAALAASRANREETLRNFLSCLSNAWAIGSGELLPDSATIISCFLSTPMKSSTQCTFPSLRLTNKSLPASLCNVPVETATSLKLAIPLQFDSAGVANAPHILLRNVSTSFMTLIDSRLRSSVFALTQAGMSTTTLTGSQMNDSHKFLTLQNILKSSADPVVITAVVTSFSMLSMPNETDLLDNNNLVSPLVFEAVVDLSILGSKITVPLRAPGAITGNFPSGQDCSLLENVELAFDTTVFLQAMMEQARFVVRRALAAAKSLIEAVTIAQPGYLGDQGITDMKNRLVSIDSSLGSVGQSVGSLSQISHQNILRHQVARSTEERNNANFNFDMYTSKKNHNSLFEDVLNGRCMPPLPPPISSSSFGDLLNQAPNASIGSRTFDSDERQQAQHRSLLHKTNDRNRNRPASSPDQIRLGSSSRANFEPQVVVSSEGVVSDAANKRRKMTSDAYSSSSDMADFRAAMVLAMSAIKQRPSHSNLQEVRSNSEF